MENACSRASVTGIVYRAPFVHESYNTRRFSFPSSIASFLPRCRPVLYKRQGTRRPTGQSADAKETQRRAFEFNYFHLHEGTTFLHFVPYRNKIVPGMCTGIHKTGTIPSVVSVIQSTDRNRENCIRGDKVQFRTTLK